MCESKVYLDVNGKREKIADEAVIVKEEGSGVVVVGLIGEHQKIENARLVEVDARKHMVILKRISNDEGIQD
ncbi:MAG: CooT family nickel-binding protein [Candidatus Hydrothermarchaeales archaeon]